MPLTLDVTNCLSSRLGGHGIHPDRIRGEIAQRFLSAHADVEGRRQSGEMGFFSLPHDREGLVRI